jgi:hypothetical protein
MNPTLVANANFVTTFLTSPKYYLIRLLGGGFLITFCGGGY